MVRLLPIATVLGTLASPLGAQAPTPPPTGGRPIATGWTMQGREPSLSRWSPLREINLSNVSRLTVAWMFSTGSLGPHEGGPLVIDSLLFVHTPAPTTVYALNTARRGAPILWQWSDPPTRGRPPLLCCEAGRDGGSHGLAWHPAGRIYVPLLRGELVALDASTGRELWRTTISDGAAGATLSGAPLVAGNVVLIGVSGGGFGVRGAIVALDAASGQELWRGYSTGPDAEVLSGPVGNSNYPHHQGVELGQRSWPGTEWQHGGGAVPGWLAWDPQLDLVYYGTGAPAPWNAEQRPGDNKWTSSIIAREVTTGRIRWAYQTTPHDAWGYGAATETLLADLVVRGDTVKALVQFNPNGFAYTLDRTTGRVLLAERYGPANWASRFDLTAALPVRDSSFTPRSSRTTTGICPAWIGAKSLQPAAFSPAANLAFAPLNNLCMSMRDSIAVWAAGRPYLGASMLVAPGPGGNRGRVIAWDPATGAVRWEVKEPFPVAGGILATASGLLFYGTLDGWIKAVDQVQGREYWRFRLPSGVVGSPITWAGSDGRQYLGILAGVGGWVGAGLNVGARPTDGLGLAGVLRDLATTTTRGGVLVVFELGR